MSLPRIEHINMTVSDPEVMAGLMKRIFGWKIRWQGPAQGGGRTIHVGSEACYLALYGGADAAVGNIAFNKGQPLNHVGVEVDDLQATERRVNEAGLKPFSHGDYDPGCRFYFFDRDGIEYEVVSYR